MGFCIKPRCQNRSSRQVRLHKQKKKKKKRLAASSTSITRSREYTTVCTDESQSHRRGDLGLAARAPRGRRKALRRRGRARRGGPLAGASRWMYWRRGVLGVRWGHTHRGSACADHNVVAREHGADWRDLGAIWRINVQNQQTRGREGSLPPYPPSIPGNTSSHSQLWLPRGRTQLPVAVLSMQSKALPPVWT